MAREEFKNSEQKCRTRVAFGQNVATPEANTGTVCVMGALPIWPNSLNTERTEPLTESHTHIHTHTLIK